MPRTTVYIRNEDWEKWKALENKSEAISRLLREKKGVEPVVRQEGKDYRRSDILDPPGKMDFCKHNAVAGFCKKGCK